MHAPGHRRLQSQAAPKLAHAPCLQLREPCPGHSRRLFCTGVPVTAQRRCALSA